MKPDCKMQMCCVIVFCVLSISSVVKTDDLSDEHHVWSKIGDYIRMKSDNLSCLKDSNFTKMNCSGFIGKKEFHVGVQVNHCENPSSVVVFIDIPELDIHNWKKSFTHGSSFDLTENVKGEVSLLKEKDNFVIGLSLDILSDALKYFPKALSAPLKIPIFNTTAFPIPSCEATVFTPSYSSVTEQVTHVVNVSSTRQLDLDPERHSQFNGSCSIYNSSCQKEEVCVQRNKLRPRGICVCRVSYSRDKSGQCVYMPGNSSTTESNTVSAPESQASYQHKISTPVLQILISVIVVLVLMGIIFVAIRFKAYQYLRRKFRVQVYEHVLLGQQEDNDEPLTDPVA